MIAFPLVLALASRWRMVASLSPDFPVMLLIVALAWSVTLRETGVRIATSMILIACAIGIKLSAAPLAIIGIALLLLNTRQAARPAGVRFVIGCAIVVPAISIGVMASGSAAYPVAATCISTPWTPSAEALSFHTQLILSSARTGGSLLAAAQPFSEVFQIWISRDRSGAFLVISAFLPVILGVLFCLLNGRFSNAARRENLTRLLCIAIIGTIFAAATAPTGRFMGGYAAVAVAIVICYLLRRPGRSISPIVLNVLLAVL